MMESKPIDTDKLKKIEGGPSNSNTNFDWSSRYNFGTYLYGKDGKFIRKAYWFEVCWVKIKKTLIYFFTRGGFMPLWLGIILDIVYFAIGCISGYYVAQHLLK